MTTSCKALELVAAKGLSISVTDDGRLQIIPGGRLTVELRELLLANKADIIAHLRGWARDTGAKPHWRWHIVFADGSAKICCFVPPAAWEEVRATFPGALSGNKIPDDHQL